jgi:hypothetical protein
MGILAPARVEERTSGGWMAGIWIRLEVGYKVFIESLGCVMMLRAVAGKCLKE